MLIISTALNAVKDGGLWFAGWIDRHPNWTAVLWPSSLLLMWWFR